MIVGRRRRAYAEISVAKCTISGVIICPSIRPSRATITHKRDEFAYFISLIVFLCLCVSFGFCLILMGQVPEIQESRAAARKPRDAASVLFC